MLIDNFCLPRAPRSVKYFLAFSNAIDLNKLHYQIMRLFDARRYYIPFRAYMFAFSAPPRLRLSIATNAPQMLTPYMHPRETICVTREFAIWQRQPLWQTGNWQTCPSLRVLIYFRANNFWKSFSFETCCLPARGTYAHSFLIASTSHLSMHPFYNLRLHYTLCDEIIAYSRIFEFRMPLLPGNPFP